MARSQVSQATRTNPSFHRNPNGSCVQMFGAECYPCSSKAMRQIELSKWATELADLLYQTQISQIILVDPPVQFSRPDRQGDPICLGIDGPNLDDFSWIDIRASSRRIARWIPVEHPSSGLSSFVAVTLQVVRTNYIAFKVD